MTDISVIVPARDAAATIGATLEALRDQDFEGDYEVVVADDGSVDDTAAIAEAAGATVVRQPRVGPGTARNAAVRASSGRVLAFTDADCRPVPGWLRAGLEALKSADLVQGRVEPDGEYVWRTDHTITITRESGLYETANLFVRREVYDQVDGFEDWLHVRFGKRLGEDAWFGWKARRAGARTGFSDAALVRHAWIRRGGRAYVLDRARRYYFPALVAKMPELRRTLLVGRVFLLRHTAEFSAAVAGVVGAVALGVWVAPLAAIPPLLLAWPYLARVGPLAVRMGLPGLKFAAVELAADALGMAALIAGSLRYRALVL